MRHTLTAIIEREDDGYVALCPQLDIASQGATLDEARANLQEALELFFETAPELSAPSEYSRALIPLVDSWSGSKPVFALNPGLGTLLSLRGECKVPGRKNLHR